MAARANGAVTHDAGCAAGRGRARPSLGFGQGGTRGQCDRGRRGAGRALRIAAGRSAQALRLALAFRAGRSPGPGGPGRLASDPSPSGHRHRVRTGDRSLRARVQARAGRARVRGVLAGPALFPGDHGRDLGARARPAAGPQRHHDADLAASFFATAPRRRARGARPEARGPAGAALRGGARRPQRGATFHAGRRRAPARGDKRDRRARLQRHGDALAPHAAGARGRRARGARRRARVHLGPDGR